ncbi:MAG: hypothetical protein ACHP7M_13930 [Burkholderiales bacterium]
MHARRRFAAPRLFIDPMLTLAIIVAIAVVAALAGYAHGLRRRSGPPVEDRAMSPVAAGLSAPPAGEPTTGGDADRIGAEKARIVRSGEGEATRLRRQLADGDAARHDAGEFRDERARLFRELADARGDNARYRQLVVDIENNAPPPILSGAAGPDDLKLIVGIGPVLERMLHNLGIMSFQQIARWTDRDIADFDSRLPEFPGRIRRDQWVTQAKALHQATYGETTAGHQPDGRRP